MKYTAWLACGGKVEVDISAAGVDLTSITEGVQWITDKYGIMLNMAHVAALVPEDAPAHDYGHEFGDPGEALGEFPRLTGPVGMPEWRPVTFGSSDVNELSARVREDEYQARRDQAGRDLREWINQRPIE